MQDFSPRRHQRDYNNEIGAPNMKHPTFAERHRRHNHPFQAPRASSPAQDQPRLVCRADATLDDKPIHVGDIVHLKPVDGPRVKARVIYNAPLNGEVSYTTDLVTQMTESGRVLTQRFRFRHEHVHKIESPRS